MNKKHTFLIFMVFILIGLGAFLKLQHASYANEFLWGAIVVFAGALILLNRNASIARFLARFRWYFGCSALVLFGMDLLVRSDGYPGNKGILAGACMHTFLFIAGFIIGRKKIIKA